jgi:hypothetical protein
MELLIIIGIMFAWEAFSSWDAEQTDETIGIRKKMKDEARWRDMKYTNPISLNHDLDMSTSQAAMVLESEGLNRGWNEKDHPPIEVSPYLKKVFEKSMEPIPAPKEKVINVIYHAEPVVDINGYQLFIGKDSSGPMTYWLQKPKESRPTQLNPSEFKGLVDGSKYGVEFHRALWLAYSNRSVQTIFDGLD